MVDSGYDLLRLGNLCLVGCCRRSTPPPPPTLEPRRRGEGGSGLTRRSVQDLNRLRFGGRCRFSGQLCALAGLGVLRLRRGSIPPRLFRRCRPTTRRPRRRRSRLLGLYRRSSNNSSRRRRLQGLPPIPRRSSRTRRTSSCRERSFELPNLTSHDRPASFGNIARFTF